MPFVIGRALNLIVLVGMLLLSACNTFPTNVSQPLALTPVPYAQLPGWRADTQQAAWPALTSSCQTLLKRASYGKLQDVRGGKAWQDSCRHILSAPTPHTALAAQALIERYFTPYQVNSGNSQGLFTGYYEPLTAGSLTRTAQYTVPVYGKPNTLVQKTLPDGSKQTLWKVDGHYVPLPTRAEIMQKPLPQTPVLAWIHSPVDLYFMQVQGSGGIVLPNGKKILLGFIAQNGYSYYPIGRYLADKEGIARNQISMQWIRQWLTQHPNQVSTVLNQDPSFVFFRVLKSDQPLGALGLPLSPGRSLAVDTHYTLLGTVLWLDTAYPKLIQGQYVTGPPLQRLMVAQDVGGAIKGPIRGDVFWGNGPAAQFYAGHMKSPGRLFILLPRGLSPRNYNPSP